MTDEDLALDREIARMAADQEMTAIVDHGAPPELKPSVEHTDLLSEYVENYKPASSHATLEEQVFLCSAHGADSIEAEEIVFKAILGYIPKEAYMVFKGVKVYRKGMVEAGRTSDAQSIEQRLFGNKK